MPARPPPVPARRRPRPPWMLPAVAAALLAAIGAGLYLGLVVARRVESGKWEMPDPGEVVEIVLPPEPPGPSRIIYLAREPVTVYPGDDNAAVASSSVVAHHHPAGPVKLPGWKGSAANWKKLLTCVKKLFAPFDVVVTDQRPTTDDFVLVPVGGKSSDLGVKNKRVSGLAPFHGGVISRPVVFAFAAGVRNDVRVTCETIGMEVAHAYGLDHAYLCSDVMTYLKPCGAKRFVDKDVACGEGKKRACHGGAPTQNSYRRLLQVLGAAPPAKTK